MFKIRQFQVKQQSQKRNGKRLNTRIKIEDYSMLMTIFLDNWLRLFGLVILILIVPLILNFLRFLRLKQIPTSNEVEFSPRFEECWI